MKTLFLIPPRTSGFNRDFAATQSVPSIGLAYIIAAVQKEFPDVALIDAWAEKLTLRETAARAAAFAPDLIAVSALTIQICEAAETVAEIKKAVPGARAIVGGPHASKIPADTLREFAAFDFAGAVEGEEITLELLRALRDGAAVDAVPGLYSRRGGEVVSGGPRPYIADVDALGFPEWKHFDPGAYCASFRLKSQGIREIPVHINRGCPFNCVFCAKIMGGKLRKRTIPRVVEEIERNTVDFGARQIIFTDETFTVDRGGVTALCESLIARGLHKKIEWTCDTRPDKVDEELIALMKRAGCFFMCFGADSVSDETLAAMNKNIAAHNIFSAVRMCRAHGIETQAAYIIGAPTDTAESVRGNIRGALKVNTDFATFSIMVPYPGTKIMEMAERGEGGLRLLSKDWRLYGKQLGYALETAALSRRDLEKLQREAYSRYYLRPKKIANIFRIADLRVIFLYALAHLLRRLGIAPGE